MTLSLILCFAFGGLVAAAITYFIMRSRSAGAEARLSLAERDLAAAQQELSARGQRISALECQEARLNEKLENERRALEKTKEELRNEFAAVAASALKSNNEFFLDLASTKLAESQTKAKGELNERQKAIETLVKPIAESLSQVNEQVRQLEKDRANAYGSLTTQVASLLETQKALQTETGKLVQALREPQARGRWGELQLRRVVELAGMLDQCDFCEQVSVTSEERRYRPDMVVRLPGGKNIVIDSKVPLAAYLAALDAPDEVTRAMRLDDHARQIRQHIDSLSGKAYWAQFEPTPEFVVLFLPGEVFFRAAMDCDPELIDYGVDRKVIVASPTTLIALLKGVAYGWNQKNMAESAHKISESGKQLYERLRTMAGHFEDLGRKLGGAVESYNKTIGSMERSVFPVARKFPELDRSLESEQLDEPGQVEKTPRHLEAPDWNGDHAEQLPLADEAKV